MAVGVRGHLAQLCDFFLSSAAYMHFLLAINLGLRYGIAGFLRWFRLLSPLL